MWFYSTADLMTTVDDTDYFANCKLRGMSVGDIVFVTHPTATIAAYIAYVNAVSAAGNATVSAGLAVT